MKRDHLFNIVWMQSLWFVAVIGAAYGLIWPAIVILLVFVGWQLQTVRRVNGDLPIVLVAVFLGMLLDSTWIRLGWIEFSTAKPIPDMAPLWILILWVVDLHSRSTTPWHGCRTV